MKISGVLGRLVGGVSPHKTSRAPSYDRRYIWSLSIETKMADRITQLQDALNQVPINCISFLVKLEMVNSVN